MPELKGFKEEDGNFYTEFKEGPNLSVKSFVIKWSDTLYYPPPVELLRLFDPLKFCITGVDSISLLSDTVASGSRYRCGANRPVLRDLSLKLLAVMLSYARLVPGYGRNSGYIILAALFSAKCLSVRSSYICLLRTSI